ncbi:hypothetical protein [Hasllibacter sp. MH4015]|nr:hypothetical protein [Hasllibacter sp. MH4015]
MALATDRDGWYTGSGGFTRKWQRSDSALWLTLGAMIVMIVAR